jgi:hypothetical protein
MRSHARTVFTVMPSLFCAAGSYHAFLISRFFKEYRACERAQVVQSLLTIDRDRANKAGLNDDCGTEMMKSMSRSSGLTTTLSRSFSTLTRRCSLDSGWSGRSESQNASQSRLNLLGMTDSSGTDALSTPSTISRSRSQLYTVKATSGKRASHPKLLQCVSHAPQQTAAMEAMSSIDSEEVLRFLHTSAWLGEFIAAVENLPIAVTLAKKKRLHDGQEFYCIGKPYTG